MFKLYLCTKFCLNVPLQAPTDVQQPFSMMIKVLSGVLCCTFLHCRILLDVLNINLAYSQIHNKSNVI